MRPLNFNQTEDMMSKSIFFRFHVHYFNSSFVIVLVSQVPDELELQDGDEEEQDKQLE